MAAGSDEAADRIFDARFVVTFMVFNVTMKLVPGHYD
jgi:hypothetical protein